MKQIKKKIKRKLKRIIKKLKKIEWKKELQKAKQECKEGFPHLKSKWIKLNPQQKRKVIYRLIAIVIFYVIPRLKSKWIKLNPQQKRKVIYMSIAIVMFYVINHWTFAFRHASNWETGYLDGNNILPRAIIIFILILVIPFISFYPMDFLMSVLGGGVILWQAYLLEIGRGKFRDKEEYGSARWGTAEEILPFMDNENPFNNIILTQTEGLSMQHRMSEPKYDRNKNVEVIGGSGTGKTYFVAEPNILQMYGSYVVTDPKGDLVYRVGKVLTDNGYSLRVLNLVDMQKSMRYNPFAYIHTDEDIMTFTNTLIANTKVDGEKEDIWVRAEKPLYNALIGLIRTMPEEDQNISTMIQLFDSIKASNSSDEDDEVDKFETTTIYNVDELFLELQEKEPDCFAVRQYRKFKKSKGVICCKRLLNQLIRRSFTAYNILRREALVWKQE